MLAEENEKNLSSQDDRFALRATVIPSEGRVVIQKKEDVTEEEVTEMGFIGISVMANRRSVAISTTVAEPEKELMRMTSLLSSLSTVIELQGEKAAIDAACRAAGKEAAEIGTRYIADINEMFDFCMRADGNEDDEEEMHSGWW